MPRVRMPPGTTPAQLISSLNSISVGTPVGAYSHGDSPFPISEEMSKVLNHIQGMFTPYNVDAPQPGNPRFPPWKYNPWKELRSVATGVSSIAQLATPGPGQSQEEPMQAPAAPAQPQIDPQRLETYRRNKQQLMDGTLPPDKVAAFWRLQAAGRFKDIEDHLAGAPAAPAPAAPTPAAPAPDTPAAGGGSLLDLLTPASQPAPPGTPTTQATAPDATSTTTPATAPTTSTVATSTTPASSTTSSSLDPMARRVPRPEDFGDAPGTVTPGTASAGPHGTQRKPAQLAGRGFQESFTARMGGGSLKEHALNVLELPGSMTQPDKMTQGVGSALTLLGTPGAAAGAGAEKLSGSRTAGDVAQLGVDYGPAVVGAARLLPGAARVAGRAIGRGAAGEIMSRKLARTSQRVRDVLPQLAQGGERMVTESLETARRATPPRLLQRADILAATPQPTYPVGGGLRLPVRNPRTLSNRSFVPGNPEGPITMADQLITPELSAIRNAAGRHADALDNLTTMMGELTGHPREQAQLARQAVDRIHADIPDLARRFPAESKRVERALRSMERQIGTRRQIGQYETLAYTIGQLLSAAQRGNIGEPTQPVRRDTAFAR